MLPTHKDPTQQDLDWLYRHGFIQVAKMKEVTNKWLFIHGASGKVYDLSASDLETFVEIVNEVRNFNYTRLGAIQSSHVADAFLDLDYLRM